MIHHIGDSRFTPELVQDLIYELKRYLELRPDHLLGVCWWLTRTNTRLFSNDAAYEIMCACRKDLRVVCPEGVNVEQWRERNYVTDKHGQQHERVEMVQRILDFLVKLEPTDFVEEPNEPGPDSTETPEDAGEVRPTAPSGPPQSPRPPRRNHPR